MADGSHRISLEEALVMVARARREPAPGVKAWQFAGGILREILDHPDVAGLRMYMARNADDQQTLVLVGTDAQGRDVSQGTLAEEAFPCPPFCDEQSPFFDP